MLFSDTHISCVVTWPDVSESYALLGAWQVCRKALSFTHELSFLFCFYEYTALNSRATCRKV